MSNIENDILDFKTIRGYIFLSKFKMCFFSLFIYLSLTVFNFCVISDSCISHNCDSATCVGEVLNGFVSEHEPQSSRPKHAQLQ